MQEMFVQETTVEYNNIYPFIYYKQNICYLDSNAAAEPRINNMCCKAVSASCLACSAGQTIAEYCEDEENQEVDGCKGNHLYTSCKLFDWNLGLKLLNLNTLSIPNVLFVLNIQSTQI